MTTRTRTTARLTALITALSSGACSYTGRLAEFDFRGASVAAVERDAGTPELVDVGVDPPPEWLDIRTEEDVDKIPGLLEGLLFIATEIFEDVEIEDAGRKLAEVPYLTDVTGVMGAAVLPVAAAELGARVGSDAAVSDFHLVLRVDHWGLVVHRTWEETGYVLHAGADLVEATRGELIWTTDVEVSDTGSDPFITGRTANAILTAGGMAGTSADDMARAFNALAEEAAEEILERLHRSVEAARGG